MEIPNILLLYLTSFVFTHGSSSLEIADQLQDVTKENNGWIIKTDQDFQSEDISFEGPCPNAEDIAPCICTFGTSTSTMALDCSDVESEEQLKRIFESEFPAKNFSEFKIWHNQNLKVLESTVFGDVSFEYFELWNNTIEVVEPGCFDSSYNTSVGLYLVNNKITSFPFNDISKFLKVEDILLCENYQGNLSIIPADAFYGLSNLFTLRLDGNHATFTGTFQSIPKLWVLNLTGNSLPNISANFFKTGADIALISLEKCNISNVEPGAFETLGSYSLHLSHNLLTTFEEATWRPLLDAGVLVYVFVDNNPLKCGCDVAWLFGEDDYLDRISPDTTCSDGQYLNELDPSDFDDC